MNLVYAVVTLAIMGGLVYAYWKYITDTHIVKIKKSQIVEFKTSFDLTGLPIIVFYQGDRKYNFLMDSGSNMSYINADSNIEMQMTKGKDVFMGADGSDISCRYANVKLYLNNMEYDTKVAVADLSSAFTELKSCYGVTLTGIIGCDFMNKYSYCLDFMELVVYKRK